MKEKAITGARLRGITGYVETQDVSRMIDGGYTKVGIYDRTGPWRGQ